MTTETVIEDARWADLEAQAERAVSATLAHIGLSPDDWEVTVLGCDDTRIAALNNAFRGKPVSTNVLSWPSADRATEVEGAKPEPPEPGPELGDIAIAYDTCLREAQAADKTLENHSLHLIVHGTLHLLGYDHELDGDAALMESLETAILCKLGVPDPYN